MQSIPFNIIKRGDQPVPARKPSVRVYWVFQREVTGVFPPCFLPCTDKGEVWDPEEISDDGFSD